MSYQPLVYKDLGGNRQVIASGGEQKVESGGVITLKSGATLNVESGGSIARSKSLHISAGVGIIGATAGFALPSAHSGFTNAAIAGCPASQTASTFIIPIMGLKDGDTITGMRLKGQVESGGNAVTVDAALVRVDNSAADNITLTTVGSITQISKTADYVISDVVAGLTEVVSTERMYHVLITVTTGASCDVQISGVRLTVTEA
jgi:hypothetical protein